MVLRRGRVIEERREGGKEGGRDRKKGSIGYGYIMQHLAI